mmetsp:Transcript_17130/g.25352  ORF Transcript_17130/g.25352 Transcript_17130/m.25352 type:complete len:109 (+) Transcript_17130:27-353(+)
MEAKQSSAASSQTVQSQVNQNRISHTSEAKTLTLRLSLRKEVQWDAEVVDNENAGRKSSKRCCIFHKKREFGESDSDESDSDMDDEEREKYWSQPKEGRPNKGQLYHA